MSITASVALSSDSSELPLPPSAVLEAARDLERDLERAFVDAHPSIPIEIHERPTFVP